MWGKKISILKNPKRFIFSRAAFDDRENFLKIIEGTLQFLMAGSQI